MPLGSPAQSRMLGALAPKRFAHQPPGFELPPGRPANTNGSNVIDMPSPGRSQPFNWMNWPKGLPTGQETNPNGFDFGLRPQPANQPTPMDAAINPMPDSANIGPAMGPLADTGEAPMVEPFDILGKFGANDPILDPMGGASGFGGVPGLTPWVQLIGSSSNNNWNPPSQGDMSWQLGTQGAETMGGQNYAPDPGMQVDPGGYEGGAYGGMGGFNFGGDTTGQGGNEGMPGGFDAFNQQPSWFDYFGGGNGSGSGIQAGGSNKYLDF